MGLSLSSHVAEDEQSSSGPPSSPPEHSSGEEASSRDSSPFEALIAEASAFSDNENESLEMKAQKALECPCVAELRSGPCGTQFTEAFLCFMKSTANEKGSDCVNPFISLQDCIKENPDAFSKDVLEEEDDNNSEQEAQDFKIIPPSWSREAKSNL